MPTRSRGWRTKRQRRRLIQHRRSIVQRRTQCTDAIRSIFNQQGLTELLPRGNKAWTIAGIAQQREHARRIAPHQREASRHAIQMSG